MPVPHLDIGTARLVQLPPVRTRHQDFKVLVGEAGREVDDAWKAARRDRLLGVFDAERPAVVITELFPFGRRQMRFKLLPLLERARATEWAPKIISSMRDILVTKPRADRNLEIAETVERFYDHLLIHGDEAVISLRQTFPLYDRIAAKVRYTGYVVTPADGAPDDGAGADEVLVSAGGGAVGRDYMRPVFEMRPSLPAQEKVWRFIGGHHLAPDTLEWMQAQQTDLVRVESTVANLPARMARAHLSISQAGYNTVMELMATGAPAVVVPFEGGVETEQRLRADLLASRGSLQVVTEDNLTPETLSAAMDAALKTDRTQLEVDLRGSQTTSALVAQLMAR